MYLGRVVGTCVATRKYAGLEGVKLLMVQPLDRARRPKGRLQVAVDVAQAGPDDLVFLVASREASMALEEAFVPVDAAIVGIVDDLHQVDEAALEEGGAP